MVNYNGKFYNWHALWDSEFFMVSGLGYPRKVMTDL